MCPFPLCLTLLSLTLYLPCPVFIHLHIKHKRMWLPFWLVFFLIDRLKSEDGECNQRFNSPLIKEETQTRHWAEENFTCLSDLITAQPKRDKHLNPTTFQLPCIHFTQIIEIQYQTFTIYKFNHTYLQFKAFILWHQNKHCVVRQMLYNWQRVVSFFYGLKQLYTFNHSH